MGILAESAIRITVLALGVAVALRGVRNRSPRVAHAAWTAVVLVMLALPAVVRWGPTVAVPVFPAVPAAAHLFAERAGGVAFSGPEVVLAAGSPDRREARLVTWTALALTIYGAGVVFLLIRIATGAWRLRALRRTAIRERGHLTHTSCLTPMTVGVFAPSIILPPDWTVWNSADVSAVLAHEGEHARRRDPLVILVALLNRAVFWFHPLAWWLPRELSRLSEQACDAAVLAGGHDRDVYASCLLRFARRATASGGRVLPIAMAMSGSGLRERLRMLERPQPMLTRARRVSVAGACAALIVVCGVAVPVAAQRPAEAGSRPRWPVITSEHFEVLHASLPAERVRGAVRDAEAAYQRVSAALRYETRGPVQIILVDHERDLPADLVEAENLASASGARTRQRIVLALDSLDQQSDLVVHELTHHFAFEIMPAASRTAPWLIEGLAEYLRGAWRKDDLQRTREVAVTGAIPPLAAIDDGSRHWAHALFDYVAAEYGADGVRRLVFALRAQGTLLRAVPVAFDVGIVPFEQSFQEYVFARFGQR